MNEEKYSPLRSDPTELVRLLVERDHEIVRLKNIIHRANHTKYGPKTERLSSESDPRQISMGFENEAPPAPPEEKAAEIVVEKHVRTVRRGRKPLSDTLPREEVLYTPEQTHCECCNSELVKIGEYRTEELEKIPASLKVIEHVRPKMACSQCKGAKVLVAPLPAGVLPLDGARPGAGFLADIIVSKYVDHLPLHRQEGMLRRLGVELSRKRMSDWVGRVANELLAPLYEALRKELLTAPYLQADETTLKIQSGEKPDACETGYLWGLHAPPNIVWFHYDPSRAGEVPKRLLDGYRGAVQTDAYAGYNEVFLPNTCRRLACFAHIRRKFIEVQSAGGASCARLLRLIGDIYSAEKEAGSAEERLGIRVKRSGPLLEEFFSLLKTLAPKELPKSQFSQAIVYALKQESEVLRIMEHGEFHLDNNSIERQMKTIAIGRKNYYFAGSHEGGRWAAIMYSLLGTCKLNGINPWEYLRDVLKRVNVRSGDTARELLPMHWKPSPSTPD